MNIRGAEIRIRAVIALDSEIWNDPIIHVILAAGKTAGSCAGGDLPAGVGGPIKIVL
jgi:hypothetical protein